MSTQLKEALVALKKTEALLDAMRLLGAIGPRELEPITVIGGALESAQRVVHYALACPCVDCASYRKHAEAGELCIVIDEATEDRERGRLAKREASAWKAIDDWHERTGEPMALVVRFSGPFHKNADGAFFYCHLPGARDFRGDSRAEALEAAATWCRAELAK